VIKMRTGYRIHIYDTDGSLNEEGIFIYLGDSIIIKMKNIHDLEDTISGLNKCLEEIKRHGELE
jgi:hypothetical protein